MRRILAALFLVAFAMGNVAAIQEGEDGGMVGDRIGHFLDGAISLDGKVKGDMVNVFSHYAFQHIGRFCAI